MMEIYPIQAQVVLTGVHPLHHCHHRKEKNERLNITNKTKLFSI